MRAGRAGRAGRRDGARRVELLDVERVEAFADEDRLEGLGEGAFLVGAVPEVRLRGGALDRLAMSREYP